MIVTGDIALENSRKKIEILYFIAITNFGILLARLLFNGVE